MTKNSIDKFFKLIQEASKKEQLEASDIPAEDVAEDIEEKALPTETITITQDEISEILAEKDEEQQENKKLKASLEELRHIQFKNKINEDTDLHAIRKEYTTKLFILTLSWLCMVAMFVLLTGIQIGRFNNKNCESDCFAFGLAENVLIAFITSTTATVIGIFIIVAKWLFPSPPKEESKEK